ncbi:MAG: bifunctional folylpolyglutamate synthase/dihydrofolate synthase [Leptolyngbyaceae cyanobacterium SL_7_1]|nr:bifunctional folylpolyglutamate synthase/dihydrofolate synthase [Leptolyngbyaceae cyanobacterium SL_7_1]
MQAEIDEILQRFSHFGVELGLERIQRLLFALGNPHKPIPIVHVAGSNGKGSVCAYLSAVLTHAGYRVGRYTSPHLVSWNERICLNEQPIDSEELHRLLNQVVAAIDPHHPSPTQFEVITAVAWLYFAQQQVDIAVIEVGLGGRLDATNVCDRPLVTIITSLSREHWQRLGPTLADISREKAGILKPGRPAVLAPLPDETVAVIQHRLKELDCPAVFPQPSLDLGNGWAEYGDDEQRFRYRLPLAGAHQRLNSALAIAALHLLHQQGWKLDNQTIADGIAKTQWQARLQWVQWQGYSLLIDGAHNSAGARTLRHYLDTSDKITPPICWVMGMVANKDHAEIFQTLLRSGDRLYLVPVPDHISADPDELADLAQAICPKLEDCEVQEDTIAALTSAIATARQTNPNLTVILCGSLYLIGDFLSKSHSP